MTCAQIHMPTSRLAGVHPELAVRVVKILAAMDALGFPMMVTDGVRTLERQQARCRVVVCQDC
jgi:hypothetical protein